MHFLSEKLIYPPASLKISGAGETAQVFDVFRKKNVQLTPEEWVRQHLAHYMVNHLGWPAGRLGLEYSFVLNRRKMRADIICWDDAMKPFFVAECKAPGVKLSHEVLDQAARYNIILKAPWLVITNGLDQKTLFYKTLEKKWILYGGIPEWKDVSRFK